MYIHKIKVEKRKLSSKYWKRDHVRSSPKWITFRGPNDIIRQAFFVQTLN